MTLKQKPSSKKAEDILIKKDPYVGIVLEEIRDEVRTISDGYGFLQDRMDRIEERMNYTDAKIEVIDVGLTAFRAEAKEKFQLIFEGQKVLFDGQKQLMGDNQKFFDELRAMRIDHFKLDQRVMNLEGL